MVKREGGLGRGKDLMLWPAGVRSEHLASSPLALNRVSVRNISCMLSSVMKVLISVLFSGLLTERALNRAMEMSLARVCLACRGIVIRLLSLQKKAF